MQTNIIARLAAAAVLMAAVQAAVAEVSDEYAFIQESFPEIEITAIRPSPVEGLLEMAVGADLFYVTVDGKYLLMGDIYGVDSRENLTEASRGAVRARYINQVGADEGVTFTANDERYIVTVFTDIDCPYCRKLHREMAAYNEAGISIRYLFFPRKGPGSDGWVKADSVWCSDSRPDAMTAAKNGEVLEAEECGVTPVAEHYKLGRDIGIAGTPAIITAHGTLISGYRPADELLELLEEEG